MLEAIKQVTAGLNERTAKIKALNDFAERTLLQATKESGLADDKQLGLDQCLEHQRKHGELIHLVRAAVLKLNGYRGGRRKMLQLDLIETIRLPEPVMLHPCRTPVTAVPVYRVTLEVPGDKMPAAEVYQVKEGVHGLPDGHPVIHLSERTSKLPFRRREFIVQHEIGHIVHDYRGPRALLKECEADWYAVQHHREGPDAAVAAFKSFFPRTRGSGRAEMQRRLLALEVGLLLHRSLQAALV